MKNAMKIVLVGVMALFCVNEAMAGSFTDPRDGKTYKTVKMGNRIWMAENLDYEIQNSKCYGNDASNCKMYGRLYTSEHAVDACPAGWKLPDVKDFYELAAAVDPEEMALKSLAIFAGAGVSDATQYQVGDKLKSRDLWNPADAEVCVKYGCSYNYGAQMRECKGEEQCGCGIGESVCIESGMKKVLSPGEDTYGFSARPAGFFTGDGSFNALGSATAFWMKGEKDKRVSFAFALESSHDIFFMMTMNLGVGASVRCIKYTETEFAKQRTEEEKKRAAKGSFKDPRDGKKYRTVKMPDGKTWMAENLNYKMEDSYCNPKNNCGDGYGRLYTWKAAQKACPSGWRLPTKTDIEKMRDVVGRDQQERGLHLRTNHDWNVNGDDAYFFSVLPAGFYSSSYKKFRSLGEGALFWSSTESNSNNAFSLIVNDNGAFVNNGYSKASGGSVRCLQGSN